MVTRKEEFVYNEKYEDDQNLDIIKRVTVVTTRTLSKIIYH